MFNTKNYDLSKLFAVSENGTELTYEEWLVIQHKLQQSVSPRSLVMVLTTNSIGAVAGLFGLLNISSVVMPVDAGVSSPELEKLVDTYEPEYVLAPSEMQIEFVDCQLVLNILDYGLYFLKKSNCKIVDNDLAMLLTTSGSTGSQKYVRLSYKNLVSNASSIVKYLRIEQNDRPITTLPLHYSYGFSIISSHLLVGATILVSNSSIVTREFWSFADKYEATTFGGVPYTFQTMKQMRMSSQKLKTLRYVTQAGGKMSEEVRDWVTNWSIEKAFDFIVMYGQTEASPRMSYLPAKQLSQKSESIGIAIPGGRFEIVDRSNEIITKPNQIGEIWYYGDNVCLGYAESREDLNLGDINLGLLKTGDLGHYDDEGFYFIDGRISRFVKLFGNRISLDELEQEFAKSFSECAILATDSTLNVFIEDDEFDELKIKDIVSRIGIHPTSVSSHRVKEVPRNANGKIDYPALRKQFDV
jgi:acyl-CoA synthetase (AMP-forming)/AMP-acid ligase II